MNLLYANMRLAVPKIHPQPMDAWLQHINARLVGANLSLRLEPLVHPVFTEFFSLCYFLFFIYLLFSLVYYFLGDVVLLKKFVLGLFTIYGIGFLGYSLVPAAGPCHAMAGQFSVPLHGWWFTRLNAAVVARGSNGVDVFPSLHCAISCFLLFFDRRHRPWRFRLYLVPCVGLWLSTIYLRYHYACRCRMRICLGRPRALALKRTSASPASPNQSGPMKYTLFLPRPAGNAARTERRQRGQPRHPHSTWFPRAAGLHRQRPRPTATSSAEPANWRVGRAIPLR